MLLLPSDCYYMLVIALEKFADSLVELDGVLLLELVVGLDYFKKLSL